MGNPLEGKRLCLLVLRGAATVISKICEEDEATLSTKHTAVMTNRSAAARTISPSRDCREWIAVTIKDLKTSHKQQEGPNTERSYK